ncbi:MAG: hypothetical protein FWD17_08925 [Polyangiaceae bacterium]|nr:hypothetical protein [Polyangiaceae bacterium]
MRDIIVRPAARFVLLGILTACGSDDSSVGGAGDASPSDAAALRDSAHSDGLALQDSARSDGAAPEDGAPSTGGDSAAEDSAATPSDASHDATRDDAGVDAGATDATTEDAAPADASAPTPDGAPADAHAIDSGVAGCTLPAYLATETTPIGWASLNGGTTGGGSATPVLVTTLADLSAAAKGASAAVIYVKGDLEQGTLAIGSNKTIIGCSEGATIRGHVQISKSKNLVLRNLNFVGYNCAPPDVDTTDGGQCQNGQDAITVQTSVTNVWFDHDAVSDGSDGNLDITHASDFITVSYTKFFYSTQRTDPHDTGDAGHRFSSLIGHSDNNASEDTGHLNVTFHHDWWGQYVVERMPRVRFGKVHLFNNVFSSTGNNYCTRAGTYAQILLEDNVYDDVNSPWEFNSTTDQGTASISASGNDFINGTSGMNGSSGGGTAFAASTYYSYTADPVTNLEASVKASAGPM